MYFADIPELPTAVLDVLPQPVVVKDHRTRYLWANLAFERRFGVRRNDLVGCREAEVFPDWRVTEGAGDELDVLETGSADHVRQRVFDPEVGERDLVTHRRRLTLAGHRYLVAVMVDGAEADGAAAADGTDAPGVGRRSTDPTVSSLDRAEGPRSVSRA